MSCPGFHSMSTCCSGHPPPGYPGGLWFRGGHGIRLPCDGLHLSFQRRLPEQDIAQGSYIALPLTLLILLAGYNHEKVEGPGPRDAGRAGRAGTLYEGRTERLQRPQKPGISCSSPNPSPREVVPEGPAYFHRFL